MVYLRDVEEGGETIFPKLGETIMPKLGRAVVWCNIFSDGEVDVQTMHAGNPVVSGEKWIVTKWFRMNFTTCEFINSSASRTA